MATHKKSRCFQWNVPLGNGSAANAVGDGMGNVMVITGLTPDLARALDQMIDGKPDEREGRSVARAC